MGWEELTWEKTLRETEENGVELNGHLYPKIRNGQLFRRALRGHTDSTRRLTGIASVCLCPWRLFHVCGVFSFSKATPQRGRGPL